MSAATPLTLTSAPEPKPLAALCLAALGVVYGDIGTSPLYAFRECFGGGARLEVARADVLGVLSLIVWALVLVVSVKYLVLVLRADNHGEGGILALMALVLRRGGRRWVVVGLGVFGAALLYGDGVITPAISVLSALEGIAVKNASLEPFIVVLTITVLVLLFLLQRRGTGAVGALFGPVTFAWFLALGALGVRGIAQHPAVLEALAPTHAVSFFMRHGLVGTHVLGGVFLAVTGAEALYADMGHFGVRPIRVTWFALVLPALLLNYFGQGALVLALPSAVENPFYLLAPPWAVMPLVALSTAAACIASQAVISGAFSLTRQAVQLGFCPRLEIVHTSASQIGQIYVPAVNWALLAAVVALVLGFRTSGNLAGAYGIAVSSTMVITAALAFLVAREAWRWSLGLAVFVFGGLLTIDLVFLGANALKLLDGGWLSLALAAVVFVLMTTWSRGRGVLVERLREGTLPLAAFLESVASTRVVRVPGTAVFMTGAAEGTPPALLHNFKHNKIVHERVVLLTVETTDVPHVGEDERLTVTPLEQGFVRAIARFGFMESPAVPELLPSLARHGVVLKDLETSWFLGRETLLATSRTGLSRWRKALFAWLSKNARPATVYFRLPPNRVVELGSQIEL
jgi:KUP system potassium uptake protein